MSAVFGLSQKCRKKKSTQLNCALSQTGRQSLSQSVCLSPCLSVLQSGNPSTDPIPNPQPNRKSKTQTQTEFVWQPSVSAHFHFTLSLDKWSVINAALKGAQPSDPNSPTHPMLPITFCLYAKRHVATHTDRERKSDTQSRVWG